MRALVLIIDSFGIGAQPDADLYGDHGANTALHICQGMPEVKWDRLRQMGLGNCAALLGHTLPGCGPVKEPLASFGVLQEVSPGKDTTTGHWELAGVKLERPFHTFPPSFPSFPEKLVNDFQSATGHTIIGNKGASGTRIIEELGPAHLNGEGIIVYTSADSVFQIAAHTDVVGLDDLYRICETARQLCNDYNVGRVIARPFTGKPGRFTRTSDRRDYAVEPPKDNLLSHLQAHGIHTVGIGKIGDIFMEKGLDISYHDQGNAACLERITQCLEKNSTQDQFIFINLVDTDMIYGHRRDIQGYHDAVHKIDQALDNILNLMADEDILMITADHGCDPGFKGTDHTREYVPLLAFSKTRGKKNMGIRKGFYDVAQSLAAFFNVPPMSHGRSFL